MRVIKRCLKRAYYRHFWVVSGESYIHLQEYQTSLLYSFTEECLDTSLMAFIKGCQDILWIRGRIFFFRCLTLKMEALQSSETVRTTHPMTQHHMPKYLHGQSSNRFAYLYKINKAILSISISSLTTCSQHRTLSVGSRVQHSIRLSVSCKAQYFIK
jgi:hypothetical protein